MIYCIYFFGALLAAFFMRVYDTPPLKQCRSVRIGQDDFTMSVVFSAASVMAIKKVMGISLACIVLAFGITLRAYAVPVVLTFGGVGDHASVNQFYNGGTDSQGNSGTNYGVEFADTSLGLIDSDAGGSGNFANEPSPDTVLFFLSGGAATMNVAAGFDTGFSFFYTLQTFIGTVIVYDGLDATGNVLATLTLNMTSSTCSGDSSGPPYFAWLPIGVTFSGIAHSVDLAGTANQIAFDDITWGSSTPVGGTQVPEPGALGMMALGLVLLGTLYRRRRFS
ncbi:MAG: PEP-CTERM sorting domain-containing protein [Rhodanobacter sp.]